eukprot:CAMPEP_0174369122 /NCGR_PEP_ID=MMETSP0811_2-20130205/91409_1 /TAXON_ID=73025 ORGANISM="Eutreptiella gymnastica-like, Strain CCMP1594" /NCGR_SAMPLE_ID=MMETSP0811_2 /ASSEMBLY_ACC=CAM_ASM_000667 /LENGTH=66 /DNA_ID=CAMNT_0015513255 /DNA_START=182 /DNA_END=379 /DNA_ORIENTATION=-
MGWGRVYSRSPGYWCSVAVKVLNMVQALTKVAEHDPPEHQFATVTSISISSSETGKQEEEWSLKVE